MIRCLIVDDEPLSRKGIEEYVSETPFLELAGKMESAVKAIEFLKDNKVDLIFLDIHMPKLSGIEFIQLMKDPPLFVLITAYPEYALKGYDLNVLDYLVKPVSYERFLKAANKALEYTGLKNQAHNGSSDFFFIKTEGVYEKININEVLFIQGMQNYVVIQTNSRKYITYNTFKAVEDYLSPILFLKVHKSYVVALSFIDSIHGNEICIGDHRIPISRNFKEEVMDRVIGGNLLKR